MSILDIDSSDLVIMNVGIPQFASSLVWQDEDFCEVAWVPPAGGDVELLDIIDQLRALDIHDEAQASQSDASTEH